MPKAMEQALKKAGRARGYKGERLDAFVYGTMTNAGWRHGKSNTGTAMKRRRKPKKG